MDLLEIADHRQVIFNKTLRHRISEVEPYVWSVDGGRELLEGVVKRRIEKLASDLLEELLLDYDEVYAIELVDAFTYWVHALNEVAFFKKKIDSIPIFISLERNLLRKIQPTQVDYYAILREFTQNLDEQADICVGALLISLALESGLLVTKRNLALFKRLADPLVEVDGFFYIDSVRDTGAASSTRRVILDPLSVALHQRFFKPYRQFVNQCPEEKLLRSLTSSMRTAIKKLSGTTLGQSEINQDFETHFIARLPGFLFGRISDKLENSDVQEAQLARIFGLGISDSTPLDNDSIDVDQDADVDLDEQFEAEKFVKTSFISISEFEGFLDWLRKNSFVSRQEKAAIEYICHLAFYCGLRRNEAFFLNTSQICIGEHESVIRVREDQWHTLKSLSATRNLFLGWVPAPIQQRILDAFRKSQPGKSQLIVTLLSGVTIAEPIFGKANLLLRQYFNDSAMTLHGLRHSFATRSLFRLMAGSLRLGEMHIPAFLAEDLKGASQFLKSLKFSESPSQGFLWLLSKIMGHAEPRITVQTYLHHLDLMTYFAFNATRLEGFASRVNEVLGISSKEASRAAWRNQHQLELYKYPIGTAYKCPTNVLLKSKSCYTSLTQHPPSAFRSDAWYGLCSEFDEFRKLVNSRPDEMPDLAKKMAEKIYGYDFLKGLLSAYQFYKLDQLAADDALLLLSNFSEKQGFFSLPSDVDFERLFKIMMGVGFQVMVKNTSKHGVVAQYLTCKRPSIYREVKSKLLIKVANAPCKESFKPQHLLFLLCLRLVKDA